MSHQTPAHRLLRFSAALVINLSLTPLIAVKRKDLRGEFYNKMASSP